MNKKSKKKNTNKILIISATVLAVAVFGLAISKSDILSNSRISRLLRASITGKENYTISDKKDALVATANAYISRGVNIQYDSLRKTYLVDPEEATDDQTIYVDGGSLVYSIYKKAFNIDVMPTSNKLYEYASEMKDSDYVVKYSSKYDEEDEYSSLSQISSDISSGLEIGDIIVVEYDKNDMVHYHSMLVVDTNPVKVVEATGKNTYSADLTIDDEEMPFEINDTYPESTSFYEDSSNLAIKKRAISLPDYTSITGYAVIRPFGSDGITYNTNTNLGTEEINLTNSAKARLEYSGIKIVKTSDKHDNTSVNLGDTITYTIKINNTSSSAYSSIDIEENISNNVTIQSSSDSGVVTDNKIKWTNISVPANGTKNITYSVKVKNDVNYLNSYVTSDGNLDGISTGKINLKIVNTLSTTDQNRFASVDKNIEAVKNLYNSIGSGFDTNGVFDNITDINQVLSSDTFSHFIVDSNYYLRESEINEGNIDTDDTNFGLDSYDSNKKIGLKYSSLINGDLVVTPYVVYLYADDSLYSISSTSYSTIGSDIPKFMDDLYGRNQFAILRPSVGMPAAVKINSSKTNVAVGGTLKLNTAIYNSDSVVGTTISCVSSDSSKATVTTTGNVSDGCTVTGVATGTSTIKVETSNGKTDSVVVNVKASLDNNANLQKISVYKYNNGVDDDELLKEFNSPSETNNSYTIAENKNAFAISIIGTPQENTSSYYVYKVNGVEEENQENSNIVVLKPGLNRIIVRGLAESGATKDYELKITREYTDSNLLSSLSVSGSKLYNDDGDEIDFNPLLTTYRANVATDTLEDFNISIFATPKLYGANVVINGPETLVYGENIFTVDVSGVSTDTKTYTLKVNITEPISNETRLKDITVNGVGVGPLDEVSGEHIFDPDTYEYSVEIEPNVCEISVGYTKIKASQNVEIIAPSDATCNSRLLEYEINVTAESGDTSTYRLYITKDITLDAKLADLKVYGQGMDEEETPLSLDPVFDPNTNNYNLTVDYDIAEVSFTATPVDAFASVNIIASPSLEVGDNNVVEIIVSVPDGDEQIVSTYTIHITRLPSTDNKLDRLYIEGYSINPNFDSDVLNYTATVPNGVEQINVGAEYTSSNYMEITGDGIHDLEVGQNLIEIVCPPPEGESRTYTILVTRLDDISIEDVTFIDDIAIVSDMVTVNGLKDKAGGSSNVSILDKNKNEKSNDEQVATGDYLKIGSSQYRVAIRGDYDQDGEVDLYDVNKLYRDIMDGTIPIDNEVVRRAGDFDSDSEVDLYDVNALYRKCMDN